MQNTKMIKGLAGALSVSALALGMSVVATSASAATGIANTPHNLSPWQGAIGDMTTSTGNAIFVSSAGNTTVTNANLWGNAADVNAEICIFCHTPHGANQASSAPLWNKKLPGTTYTVYTSGTMNGTTTGGPKDVSLACLSCHDGTQAMDNIINAPGLDGVDLAGKGASGLALDFTGGRGFSAEVSSLGKLLGNASNTAYGTGGSIAMLSPDLSNDHPIGMSYCGGGFDATGEETTLALAGAGCADTDFNQPSVTVRNGSNWFYIETTTAETFGGATNITAGHQRDDLRLYGNGNGSATVECGSCHDPHNDVNPTFLRVSNAGSAVCLTCHAK